MYELTHRKRLGLMMKLFNFPDDRAEEAETENRPPGTPTAHERQPAAARLSSGMRSRLYLVSDISVAWPTRSDSPARGTTTLSTCSILSLILCVHDRASEGLDGGIVVRIVGMMKLHLCQRY